MFLGGLDSRVIGARRVVVRVDPGGGFSAFCLFNLPDFHCFWYPAEKLDRGKVALPHLASLESHCLERSAGYFSIVGT